MNIGYTQKTTDSAVGTSGNPAAVSGVHIVSGASGGVLILRNGTSTSGTAIFQFTGTANIGVTFSFPRPVVFPAGCFADKDANVSSFTVFYEAV